LGDKTNHEQTIPVHAVFGKQNLLASFHPISPPSRSRLLVLQAGDSFSVNDTVRVTLAAPEAAGLGR
jgi:hypothetical protein